MVAKKHEDTLIQRKLKKTNMRRRKKRIVAEAGVARTQPKGPRGMPK